MTATFLPLTSISSCGYMPKGRSARELNWESDLTCVVHNALVLDQSLKIGNMSFGSVPSAEDEEFAVNHLSSAQLDIPSAGLCIKVCPLNRCIEHDILAEVKLLVDILEVS
jgi:hypothetical protein